MLRAIVRERERGPIDGEPPGSAYRLVVEFFIETAGQARIVTALIGVRRPDGGDADSWRIAGTLPLTSIQGLYRLRVNTSVQFAARNLTIESEDLLLTLEEGSVFLVECEQGITGLVLFGRGIMQFTPAPRTERGQLRIFSGAETLTAPFDTAFVRVSPSEYRQRVRSASLSPAAINPRDLRRAEEVLAREGPKSYSLDLSELSQEVWYLLPQPGDFLAEVHTRRHGDLTYARSGAQSEDITLFDRERRKTIALYPSAERLVARGRSFDEDDLRDYDVLDYTIEATVSPAREFIQGQAELRLRVLAPELASLTFRLADSLTVTGASTAEHGRLMPLRIRNQNGVIVNLPTPLARDTEISVLISYSGRIESQDVEEEGVLVSGQIQKYSFMTPERNFLLSSRSYWYPQNPITDYATATLRITVPDGFGVVASGDPGAAVTPDDPVTPPQGRALLFKASDPLRYFALVVSRFVRVAESTVETASGDDVRVAIDTNPRLQGQGRALMSSAKGIVAFYARLLDDAPYASTTVALVESELPGGHSPGYFAILNAQLPNSPAALSWRNDPAAFTGFPDFFIAHELAHQWWGQAVGSRNYHEQWLSEGFAQYFAALYAQQTRGDDTFVGMLRQFRRWAVDESNEGPVSLGSRLGHIKGDTRVFRALVYNKGAAILHMLRRLLGDETFFSGLRRFYAEQKFQKTGTDDFRRVMEAESGRPLERFFEQWIYGPEIPRLRYATTIGDDGVTVRFEQLGNLVFDVPVTVTIVYRDGRTQDTMVPVSEQVVTATLATTGAVREVQVNRDSAAVAEFTADR